MKNIACDSAQESIIVTEPSKQNVRFQFSLRAVLLVFIMLASAIVLAGGLGFVLAYVVLYISSYIRCRRFVIPPLVEILVLLALAGIYQAMFVPAIATFSEDEKQAACHHYLTNIAQAMCNYHDTYSQFPPAIVPDRNGQPAHSWRILILPFLGYEDLYRQYKFDEPWNGSNNSLLAKRMPDEFWCPSCNKPGETSTNRVAIIGSDSVLRGNRSLNRNEISDGAANTIMLVETTGKGVHWMEPVDYQMKNTVLPSSEDSLESPSVASALILGSIHEGGFHAVMADGTVKCLQDDIAQSALNALATANGSESVELKRLVRTGPSALPWMLSLGIFLASSITMLCGAVMVHRKQALAQTQSDSP